jgi:hypothetical protein
LRIDIYLKNDTGLRVSTKPRFGYLKPVGPDWQVRQNVGSILAAYCFPNKAGCDLSSTNLSAGYGQAAGILDGPRDLRYSGCLGL